MQRNPAVPVVAVLALLLVAILAGYGGSPSDAPSASVAPALYAPSSAPRVVAGDFIAETAMLGNGMQVIVVSDHRAPLVTQLVYYKAGGADENEQQVGIAHMLEHMMFQGTSNYTGREFRDIVALHGGRENAFTAPDLTGYWQTVGRESLEVVMELESDRMRNLLIEEEAYLSEKEVVKEERRSRYESEPSGPFGELVSAALHIEHPYGRPIIGWMYHIEAFTIEDALEWYDTWYRPNNAVLVVAGDTTMAEVLPLAERYYGVIAPGELPPRFRPRDPDPIAERRVIMHDARVRQPGFTRAYLAPSRTARDGVAPALVVLADALSGGTGYLYQTLVVVQGIVASAGAYYGGTSLDATSFGVWMSPNRDSDVAAMEVALDAALDAFLASGITEEQVATAKNNVRTGLVFARDNVGRLARRIGGAVAAGLTLDEEIGWSSEIDAVTVEQVNAAARLVLDKRRSVTGLLLPEEPPVGRD